MATVKTTLAISALLGVVCGVVQPAHAVSVTFDFTSLPGIPDTRADRGGDRAEDEVIVSDIGPFSIGQYTLTVTALQRAEGDTSPDAARAARIGYQAGSGIGAFDATSLLNRDDPGVDGSRGDQELIFTFQSRRDL